MENKRPLYLTSFTRAIGIPILLWLAFTPFSGELDLTFSRFFYENGSFASKPLWDWFFRYGFWPAWALIAISIAGLFLSFFVPYRQWRNPCAVIVLTFAIGSGLIIHAGFKENWGRPRPRQVVEFGGKQAFRPYYLPNLSQPEPSKSFSCGHCSTGFTFFSLALVGTFYRSRFFWWLGWSLSWSLGLILSAVRVTQGGHFLSDVLASALIMWITAWCLTYLLIVKRGVKHERADA